MKIQNENSIAILMATYNGEKYLSEQIDSIIAQNNRDWTLYIQDDGSNDNTRRIIDEYCQKDERIVYVDLGLTHQGCCNNFMTLLNVVESKYYMFSDQDDVWLPEKIDISLEKMKEQEIAHPDKPILIFTDRILVNEKLEYLQNGNPAWNPRLAFPPEKLKKIINLLTELDILYLLCIIAGNTTLFNRKIKNISRSYLNIRCHDSNVALSTRKNGGIIEPLLTPTVLYRLHSGQTCGISKGNSFAKLLKLRRLIRFNMMMYYQYKIYGGGSFGRFLWFRLKLFVLLKFILRVI